MLLSFLDEIIQNEFSISIAECNSEKPKYYIYFDDILCTGDTLLKGLTKNDEDSKGWFFQTDADGKTNFQKFKDDKEFVFSISYLKVAIAHRNRV